MRAFYNDAYVAPAHEFETTRKSAWLADRLHGGGFTDVELADPAGHVDLAEMVLEEVHDADYVHALRTGEPNDLAVSQGFAWDEGIWTMAVNSTAGVLAAVENVLDNGGVSGSLSSGLHHARVDRGSGFCTVNGLAAAARYALARVDGTVVILDVDAHCGGGTHGLVSGDERVLHLDLSVNRFDGYSPVGRNRLEVVSGGVGQDKADSRYLDELDELLAEVPEDASLVLYNAGMDPHPDISSEALAERERRVAAWRAKTDLPLAFVLAGGYLGILDQDELVDLHLHTVRAFAETGLDAGPTACHGLPLPSRSRTLEHSGS